MDYAVYFVPSARREYERLPRHVQLRIDRWVAILAQQPRPPQSKRLQGRREFHRVHAIKDYVILYTIDDDKLIVVIIAARHRRDVYRKV